MIYTCGSLHGDKIWHGSLLNGSFTMGRYLMKQQLELVVNFSGSSVVFGCVSNVIGMMHGRLKMGSREIHNLIKCVLWLKHTTGTFIHVHAV